MTVVALCAAGVVAPHTQAADAGVSVINGSQVTQSVYDARWPFIVSLVDSSAANARNGHYCGGSLVAPRLVVTAAHCVTNPTVAPSELDIVSGRLTLSTTAGQRIDVQAIHVHPNYNSSTMNNDVAVVVLATAATRAQIRMVSSSEDHLWGNGAGKGASSGGGPFVAGWGNTSTTGDSYPDTLRQAAVPIRSDAVCSNTSQGGPAGFNPATMICGSILNSTDTCQGDSGGPLIVSTGTGAFRLAGITSWGYGCASDSYGVYTRIAAVRGWVQQYIDSVGGTPSPPVSSPVDGSPTDPQNVAVVSRSPKSIKLSWDPPLQGGAAYYELYRYIPSRDAYINMGWTDFQTYTFTGLVPDTSYYLLVAAVDANGDEGYGTEVKVRTPADTVAPKAPGVPRLLKRSRTSLTFTWAASTDNVGVVRYEVQMLTGAGWRTVQTTPARTRSVTRTNLKAGRGYSFRVIAVDRAGNRSRSGGKVLATLR